MFRCDLATELDRTETEGLALSSRGGSGFFDRSRFNGFHRSVATSATAAARRGAAIVAAAVATAAAVTRATAAALLLVTEQAVTTAATAIAIATTAITATAIAAATVTGNHSVVAAHQADANQREENRNAQDQSAIHPTSPILTSTVCERGKLFVSPSMRVGPALPGDSGEGGHHRKRHAESIQVRFALSKSRLGAASRRSKVVVPHLASAPVAVAATRQAPCCGQTTVGREKSP